MNERLFGRFTLVRPLGRGGIGEVDLVRDETSRTECALKRLRRDVLSDRAALAQEFALLAKFRHPSVIEVLELGYAPDGSAWYTMPYVAGRPADDAVREHREWLPFVAVELALGIEALHAAGIVHGDLKPSNVLVVPSRDDAGGASATRPRPAAVRILDFGVATHLAGHAGTAGFAAPEVVAGAVPSPASDLYGLGATLYALVAGRCAFEGVTAAERLRRQAEGAPAAWPLEQAGAAPGLVARILSLMAPSPDDRPRSTREVREDLERGFPGARRTLAQRLGTSVLAGREQDLAKLESWTRTGRARMLLLLGDPGIGRTSLLDAFAARCALEGRRLLRVRALAGTGAPDFLALLLRQLAALSDESPGRAGPGDHADERADHPRTEAAELEAIERQALGLLRDAGRDGGLPLLLVDDADALESGTLALLRRLALSPEQPVMLVLDWPGSTTPVDLRALELAGEVATLALRPLDHGDLEALVAARLGAPAPAALVSALGSLAAGHPGLTVELLRAAAASGALVEDESGLRVDAERLAALRAPASFTATRLARLASAADPARLAALALAVCGGSAAREALTRLAPVADDAAIAELMALGLVRDASPDRVALVPPALVAALLEDARVPDVAALHRAAIGLPHLDAASRFRHFVGAGDEPGALRCAAEAWMAAPETAPVEAAAALAERLGHADAPAWHARAAERAWAGGRYEASATHHERALALDPQGPENAARWAAAAAAWFRVGRLADAARAVGEGLARAPGPDVRGRLLVTESARLQALGDHAAAAAMADEALRLCAGAGDLEGEGHAALTAGAALLALDRWDDVERMVAVAEERYARREHALGLSRACQLRGLLQRRRGRTEDALACQARALEHARGSRSRLAEEEVQFKLAQLHGDLGHGAECREAYRAGLRIALEDGRGPGASLALLNLAQFEAMSGHPRRALALAPRAVRLARAYRPALEFFAWRALAQARRGLGRLRAAERAAERAYALAAPRAGREDLAWCRVELCRVLAESGRLAAAFAEATREGVADAERWSPGHAVLELMAGRAALRLGDRHRAAAAVHRAQTWLARRASPYVEAVTSQLRAELALAEGRIGEAVERLGTALDQLERIPAPHDRAMAFLDMARLGSGPRTDARVPVGDWARQAATRFREHGNVACHRQALEIEAAWLRRQVEHGVWDVDRGLLEKVGRLLHVLTNYSELTHQAMQLAVEQFDAERGVLLVEDAARGTLEPIAQYGATDATSEREAARFSRRLVERVIREGTGVLVYDAPADPEAATESVMNLAIRAMLCVPMFLHGRVVGAVYLDSRRVGAFGEADRRLLDGFAQMMAAALESSRATERLAEENRELRREMTSRVRAGLIGSSRALQRLVPAIEKAARSTSTVLLTGETGTGKDLVAKVIHRSGLRRGEPFVSINCGSLVESMLESELFGIRDRVATGVGRNEGRFQKAHRGTIFLDEIGDMPLHQQVKLLSVLTDGEVIPIGGDPIAIDVRVIAATNYDLEALVEQGRFRADLYHRLNVIRIHLPPLRDRKGDIPELARHFAAQFAGRGGYPEPELAPDFIADLMRQDWPGNVRQLENYIERRIVMEEPEVLHAEARAPDAPPGPARTRGGQGKLTEQLNAFERQALLEALRRAGGNQSRAAKSLGLTEPTFRNRLLKHGIASRRKLRT